MAGSFVIDPTTNFLGKALNVSAERHGLITSNVANIDTVGYQPKDIDFNETLAQALESESPGELSRTHPQHFDQGLSLEISGHTRGGSETSAAAGIDQEMTRLAENNIKYRTSLEMLLRKMSMLKHTIAEGGR